MSGVNRMRYLNRYEDRNSKIQISTESDRYEKDGELENRWADKYENTEIELYDTKKHQ